MFVRLCVRAYGRTDVLTYVRTYKRTYVRTSYVRTYVYGPLWYVFVYVRIRSYTFAVAVTQVGYELQFYVQTDSWIDEGDVLDVYVRIRIRTKKDRIGTYARTYVRT